MMLAFAVLAGLAVSVHAHSIFQQLYVNGVSPGHLVGIRYPSYDGPITDVTSSSLTCNGNPNPLTTPYSQTVINVAAGATVTTEWHHTLNSTPSTDSSDPIDASHLGPIMTYLVKVSDATMTTPPTTGWFKIYEDGLDNGTWAVTKMIANAGKVSFTIPSCLPSGNYFLRHELIALHAAESYPGAQLYMECAQINITGGGSASPATYSIPGIYAGSDPGITYNLYSGQKTYTIPGPPVFTCGGSASSAPSSSTPTSTSSSSVSKSTASSSTSTTSSPSGTVAKYGQCGGTGYTGPTTCAAGSTCTSSSPYYSQCL